MIHNQFYRYEYGGDERGPKSWRLLYRDEAVWKPMAGASDYGAALDQCKFFSTLRRGKSPFPTGTPLSRRPRERFPK
ncbi:MAG: hypothetical protein WCO56_08910 [Verrucomicrobiota bacterium]